MSTFMNGVDPFEGVRSFPREPEQLLHHLSRVNHTLQTRYYIAPEIAEFALQPDKSADFHKFYQKEVQQIIAHLNKSTRSSIKVRVDGQRLAKGLEIINAGQARRQGSRSVPPVDCLEEGDASWQLSMAATAKKLADQHLTEHQCFIANNGATPSYSTRCPADEMLLSTGGGRGGGGGIVDSMAKPRKDSFLFTTPPEFKGFHNAPMSSPSEADGVSPPNY